MKIGRRAHRKSVVTERKKARKIVQKAHFGRFHRLRYDALCCSFNVRNALTPCGFCQKILVTVDFFVVQRTCKIHVDIIAFYARIVGFIGSFNDGTA